VDNPLFPDTAYERASERAPERWPSSTVATVPAPAVRRRYQPSYTSSGLAVIDAPLAALDRVTHGRAGVVQRAVTYLTFGGVAALVNLGCLYLCYQVVKLPVMRELQWWIAQVIAAEVSILANFLPNDRVTFRRLPGHSRSWWVRCWRFHATAVAGVVIMLVISSALHLGFGVPYLLSQAISIVAALCWNFSMHHLWTYRHVKPAVP
jgi:putative flippase GtrA